MLKCPIIRKDIDDDECHDIIIESYKNVKEKKAEVPNKIKRITGWKSICQNCINHKKES